MHSLYVAPNPEHKHCLGETTLAGAAASPVTALMPESGILKRDLLKAFATKPKQEAN